MLHAMSVFMACWQDQGRSQGVGTPEAGTVSAESHAWHFRERLSAPYKLTRRMPIPIACPLFSNRPTTHLMTLQEVLS